MTGALVSMTFAAAAEEILLDHLALVARKLIFLGPTGLKQSKKTVLSMLPLPETTEIAD